MNAFSFDTGPCILRGKLHPSFIPAATEAGPPHDLLTKADFLHAVESLAGQSSKPGRAALDTDDMETVCMSCPYSTWEKTFGEPRDFREYRGIVSDPPVEVWEQPCSDGAVRCVGYFVDDPRDGPCVILTRVCLF